MPQRLLRPQIRQSKRWNRCSLFAQSMYIRLLTLVDDFARYEADPELISSECFPYGDSAGIRCHLTAIVSTLEELELADMLIRYEYGGVSYLQLTRWKERIRADESKYPAPPVVKCGHLTAAADICCHVLTNAASPPQPQPSTQPSPPPQPARAQLTANVSEPQPDYTPATLSHQPTIAAAEKWLADWKNSGADYTDAEMRSAFLALEASGWMWGKNPVTGHRAALERQIQTDRSRKPKEAGGKRPLTIHELRAVIETKQALAKALRDQYASEAALGTTWSSEAKRKEYAALKAEIKALMDQMSRLGS